MIGQQLLEYLIAERKKVWDEFHALNPRYGMFLVCRRIVVEERPDLLPEILRYWELKGKFNALSDALQKFVLLAHAEGIEIHLPSFVNPNAPTLPVIKFLEKGD